MSCILSKVLAGASPSGMQAEALTPASELKPRRLADRQTLSYRLSERNFQRLQAFNSSRSSSVRPSSSQGAGPSSSAL